MREPRFRTQYLSPNLPSVKLHNQKADPVIWMQSLSNHPTTALLRFNQKITNQNANKHNWKHMWPTSYKDITLSTTTKHPTGNRYAIYFTIGPWHLRRTPISFPIVNRHRVAPPRVYGDSMTFVGDMFHLGRWVRMGPSNSPSSRKGMAIHGLLIVEIYKPFSKITTVTPCLGLYSSPLLYDEFPKRIRCSPSVVSWY